MVMRSWTAPPANDSQAPRGACRSQHWPAGASASSLSAALATPAPRQLEQDMYRDTVTLTVSAEQRGRESEAVDNPNVAIGLESVEPGVLKLHFEGQLDAPENATHICFSLTIGLTYYGPILDGAASENGGWMTFESDMLDPAQLA
ncbi:hypothetical protein ALP65_03172 [Pseudomonas aeruginosa]|uniref:Uncharacterized protein n=14 Tax=Gammaproteobacteria TaxID=1236 RepID=A0A3M5DC86_PSEAI|nr:hypothetical protein ALP65_03172 [Pseudomonas aeruginosa]